MKRFLTFAVFLVSVVSTHGQTINRNSSMELGVLNGPVPGMKFENIVLSRAVTRENPDRIYYPVTVEGGVSGRCTMLPGYKGLRNYRFSLEDFYIHEDCEVEISFDAKAGPNEEGKYSPDQRFSIDFRANSDLDRGKGYPMLNGFTFRPSRQWKHFSKRFKIKAWSNFYSIWVLPKGKEDVNTLYLDNFRFARVDVPQKMENEYAVTFHKVTSLYRTGEPVRMTFRAILASREPSVSGSAELRFLHDRKLVSVLPVTLTRQADGIYEGDVTWNPNVHGSLSASLVLKEIPLKRIGGDFVVLHDPVFHPRFSPGWALGSNTESGFTFVYKDTIDITFICLAGGFEKTFRDMRLSGQSLGRVWGFWKVIEPEQGRFRSDILDDAIQMLKKYQIEPVFCLVGNFHTRPDIKTVLKRDRQGFPAFLAKWHTVTRDNRDAVLMVPIREVYGPYLDFVLKTWKDDVKIWEMSNEPGLLIQPPDGHTRWYLDFCKYTYETIKKEQPDSILLGNGVTGDFGMNMVGWCQRLNAEDPDYVNYLDGVAFHPYRCGLDYINGMYFRYRDVVRDISRTLKVRKPLWNTENYYLETAYSRQVNYYLNKERYGANEVARQFLDGFLNGVKATLANSTTSFYRPVNVNGLAAPNDVFAATNALSWLLKDMDRMEEVPLSSWIRAGMFTSRDGKQALGFLYDLRPSGSIWIPGESSAQVRDIYGNPVREKNYALRFEPYYISGTPAEVEKLLKGSEFRLKSAVEIRARQFGNITFFEGKNLTGQPIEVEAMVGSLPVTFSYRRDPVFNTIAVDGFQGSLNGISRLPVTPSGDLPTDRKLENGSSARISFDGKNLVVKIDVQDPQIRNGNVFHEGSCMEVFVDPEPFRNLGVNAVYPLQFFGTPDGRSGALKKGRKQDFAFAFQSVRTESGWKGEFQIPLQADYIGMDVIVTRGDGEKERFPGISRAASFKERFHYPLFRVCGKNRVRNGSFEKQTVGIPDHWFYTVRHGCTFAGAPGYTGHGMAVEVAKPQHFPALITQRVDFPAGKYKRGTLTFLAKLENLQTVSEGKGRHGLAIRLAMNRGGESYTEKFLKKDLAGSRSWKLYQIPVTLKNNTDFLEIKLGIGSGTTGKVIFDNVKLELEPEK